MTDSIVNILQISHRYQDQLEKCCQGYEFDQTGPVIHKGQAVSGAYLVLQGRLRVYTYSPLGNEATLYHLHAGEICVLTLNCLFNNLRYPAWVEANADSKVAMIPGELYRQLFADEPQVRDRTLQAMSTLVFRLMDELEQVHLCNLEQRLGLYLLNHSDSDGLVKMTQQQLAANLSTSREVVARHIQQFNRLKLIKTTRGRIQILDNKTLAELVTPARAHWPK